MPEANCLGLGCSECTKNRVHNIVDWVQRSRVQMRSVGLIFLAFSPNQNRVRAGFLPLCKADVGSIIVGYSRCKITKYTMVLCISSSYCCKKLTECRLTCLAS